LLLVRQAQLLVGRTAILVLNGQELWLDVTFLVVGFGLPAAQKVTYFFEIFFVV
jgi:hypothetical protein